ncbi:MAG: hypothetical protein AVO33_11315 [delta proteobacterium ML8_F1]|nr:MAG: hypothetical protein AVO33_11315 [delta proteobacterium ML8_F1]
MVVVMALLVIVALGLHLNPSDRDLMLKPYIRLLQLVFCLSTAVFIPAVIENLFREGSVYDLWIFHPVIMFSIGTVFSIGLELLVYGKLTGESSDTI